MYMVRINAFAVRFGIIAALVLGGACTVRTLVSHNTPAAPAPVVYHGVCTPGTSCQ